MSDTDQDAEARRDAVKPEEPHPLASDPRKLEPNAPVEDVTDHDLHDPETVGASTGVFRDVALRIYGICRGGIVRAMRFGRVGHPHPFGGVELHRMGKEGDPLREHVVDVTGADCQPGFLVDNKGNVGPKGTRVEPLDANEPAYHDRHVVAPLGTAEQSRILSRPPVDAPAEAPSPAMTDAKMEQVDPERAENHQDHGHQEPTPERHDEPVDEAAHHSDERG